MVSRRRIPSFASVQDEAAFWDSHDSADYEAEFVPVDDVKFVRRGPPRAVTVRLDEDENATLKQLAQDEGVEPSALARRWIIERLGREAKGVIGSH